jgi:hypothetical protein
MALDTYFGIVIVAVGPLAAAHAEAIPIRIVAQHGGAISQTTTLELWSLVATPARHCQPHQDDCAGGQPADTASNSHSCPA